MVVIIDPTQPSPTLRTEAYRKSAESKEPVDIAHAHAKQVGRWNRLARGGYITAELWGCKAHRATDLSQAKTIAERIVLNTTIFTETLTFLGVQPLSIQNILDTVTSPFLIPKHVGWSQLDTAAWSFGGTMFHAVSFQAWNPAESLPTSTQLPHFQRFFKHLANQGELMSACVPMVKAMILEMNVKLHLQPAVLPSTLKDLAQYIYSAVTFA